VSHVEVDHLVVAATSLAQGVAWCERTLGVTPGPGGKHGLMSTHNRLLKVATPQFAQAYLEIIAIDPDAPAPGRVRWFGLDDPAQQARLQEAPRLVHLVARSTMLDMHRWGLITVGHKPGDPVNLSRPMAQGELRWQMLVRDDGGWDCGGALPTLLQWQGVHPTDAMADSGITLRQLTLHGVPERARQVLRLRGVAVLPEAGPALRAVFSTPLGDVTLES
jgi:Glyoxalase-like domain